MSDKQVVVNEALAGSNVIKINQKTMQQAIEYWLNNVVLRQPVTVSYVEEIPNENVFLLSVSAPVTPE